MSGIYKKLQQVVENTHKKLYSQNQIMPVPTNVGILVGTVLIVSKNAVKDLVVNNEVIYKEISLNAVAIRLANIVSKYGKTMTADSIYRADQDYGRWLQESQTLRAKYQSARKQGDNDRADIYLARYCSARDRAKYYHAHVLSLIAK
jgi:vancomycin permeability regulator SanA